MALLLRNAMRASRGFVPRQVAVSTRFFGAAREPKEVLSPGGKEGEIPETIEQSAGKAYEEQVLAEEGLRRFNRGPVVGAFGTVEKPALIFSGRDERIVGCVGDVNSADGEHQVNWFNLKKGQKTMCVVCGQIFLLTDESPAPWDAPEED